MILKDPYILSIDFYDVSLLLVTDCHFHLKFLTDSTLHIFTFSEVVMFVDLDHFEFSLPGGYAIYVVLSINVLCHIHRFIVFCVSNNPCKPIKANIVAMKETARGDGVEAKSKRVVD